MLAASLRSSARAAAAPRVALARSFSTTPSAADYARMQLLGRLVADPETRTTRNGKDFLRYTLATQDPLVQTEGESAPTTAPGEYPERSSSFHNIFVFGESQVQRLAELKKGTQMVVEAEFRVQRTPATDEGGQATTNYLVQHRSCHIVSKPKTE